MRRFIVSLITAVLTVGAIGVGGVMIASANADKVTICHATASESNPYVQITVDINSIVDTSGHGNSGVNEGDIIPPFTYDQNGEQGSYPGHNWTTEGQDIYGDGCAVVDDDNPTPSPSPSPNPTPNPSPNPTPTPTPNPGPPTTGVSSNFSGS